MGLGVSVHDTHGMNTVRPVIPEVTDQEVSLLFCGLWRQRAVPVCQTTSPCRLSLWTLHGAPCEDKGVIAHVRGGGVFAAQVFDLVLKIIVTRHDEAAVLVVQGVADKEGRPIVITKEQKFRWLDDVS